MRRHVLALTLALVVLIPLAAPAAGVTLVSDGQPVATIVLAENPTRGAQLGAFELRHFVFQMTGADLAIVREPALVAGPRVLIGESAATRKLGIDTSKLKSQEQIVRTSGADLVLLGKDQQVFGEYKYGIAWYPYQDAGLPEAGELGTPFAVYTLLEKLGVRWYWPGDLGTVIPRAPDLTVPALNLKVAPFMSACHFNGYNPRPLSQPWINVFRPETLGPVKPAPEDVPLEQLRWLNSAWRLRNEGGRGALEASHSTLLRSYIQRAATTHPEWWGTNKPVFGSQMCLTNPGLIDQVVKDIVDVFTGKEDRVAPTLEGIHLAGWKLAVAARSVALGMEDTNNFCQCPNCKAMYDPFDKDKYKMGFSCGTQSRYVWTFVSTVAQRVKAAVPDVRVGCIAYWVYFYPPTGLEIPDNVLVVPCLHWPYHTDPVIRDYERRAVADWGKLAPGRVATYAYYLFPAYSTVLTAPAKRASIPTWNLAMHAPRMLAGELTFAAEHGTRGFTAELNSWPIGSGGLDNVIWNHLNMWITYQVSRDPSVNVDALLKEYYRLFYGPAEVPMGKFWDGLEKMYMSPEHADNEWCADRVLEMGECLKQARALLPEADSLYRRRVEMVNNGVFNTLDDSRRLRSWPVAHDFEDQSLLAFNDIFGTTPPKPDQALIATEEVDGKTNHFLSVPGYFNAMRSLPVPLKVEGDLATIEVSMRMRSGGAPAGFFLTTLSQPDGGAGSYLSKKGTDFAFGVNGYNVANNANFLSFYAGGKSVNEATTTPLLPDTQWHTVRLVYERDTAWLACFVDGKPYLTQIGVKLEGAVFNGLWLCGHGSAYDDLSLTWTRKGH